MAEDRTDVSCVPVYRRRGFHPPAFTQVPSPRVGKVLAAGGQVIKVGRYFPSSKLCSQCHTIHPDLELSDRVFTCVNDACGYTADRDLNAALNVFQEALRLWG